MKYTREMDLNEAVSQVVISIHWHDGVVLTIETQQNDNSMCKFTQFGSQADPRLLRAGLVQSGRDLTGLITNVLGSSWLINN